MAFSLVQTWADADTAASTSTPLVLVSVPTAGNLLVACVTGGVDTTQTFSIADNIGDSVAWNTAVGPQNNPFPTDRSYIFWKVVGTPSGGLKTITATATGAETHFSVMAAEYAGGGGTIVLDGTPTSASAAAGTNPAPGAITTVSAAGLVIGYCTDNNADPTTGAGYTRYLAGTAHQNFHAIEDQFTTVGGSYNPGFSELTGGWAALGVAFKVSGAAALPRKEGIAVNGVKNFPFTLPTNVIYES